MNKNDTKQHLFEVFESKHFKFERYTMLATDAEMKAHLKAKREFYGYVPGVGGNRNYTIWAVYMDY